MKRLTITLSFALFFAFSYAQEIESVEWKDNSKFSIGLHLGGSQSGTDTHSWGRHGEGILDKAGFAYGLNANYKLSDNFGLRANFIRTTISGDDADLGGPCNQDDGSGTETEDLSDSDCHPDRGWSFESPLTEIGLDLEWELFGHKRSQGNSFYDATGNRVNVRNIMMSDATYYDKDGNMADLSTFGQFKKIITPYVGVGIALTLVDPELNFGEGVKPANFEENRLLDEENFKSAQWQLPITLGLRMDLSERLFLDLEARGSLQTSDMLDGMQAVTSNSNEFNNDDSYQMLLARVSYRLGGVGDSDGDGINDNYDQCPNEPGLVSQWGCPDTDGDGIIDKADKCPNIPGIKRMNGCPDTDGDNIADNEDDCPKVAGIARFNGCPDTDGDGIQDKDDKCVNTPGEKAYDGCPAPDRDKDGVLDANDPCPDTYGTVRGCPDTDGDGIIDMEDKCPTVKGIAAEMGCPKRKVIVKPTVSRPVLLTCETIYFNTNQSSVSNNTKDRYLDSKENMAIFNRALAKLKENPSYRAVVQGHTDSRNTEEYNQKLSERRANEVLQDLLTKGFDAGRTSAIGFGELSPVASNDSKEGRAQNRRVEICIYDR